MLINRTFYLYVALMTLRGPWRRTPRPVSAPRFDRRDATGRPPDLGRLQLSLRFLVTDLTNRQFGPRIARRVVVAGFAVAVMLSVLAATPRIAIASGSAFLLGQLLDISIFNRLRRQTCGRRRSRAR